MHKKIANYECLDKIHAHFRKTRMIRSTAAYLFVSLYILALAPFALLWASISGDPSILYILARFCIRTAGWMAGIRVVVRGKENIALGQTYVFLSNHQGNIDGPVLVHVAPRDLRALVKAEMMRLPVFSNVLRKAGFIPIERTNPKKAHQGIELGIESLAKGNSFFAFPEGTRSRDGSLGEFKKGVFIMAIKAQIPVLPVTIRNSSKILPPGKFSFLPGTVEVTFHAPISTAGMTFEDRVRLVQLTREAIESSTS
jgi:1-acyl-sn-glycerol-3-phosphate acyltransferase